MASSQALSRGLAALEFVAFAERAPRIDEIAALSTSTGRSPTESCVPSKIITSPSATPQATATPATTVAS